MSRPGLRTWDMQNPFPEEANRVIAGKLARWHFAPTEGSRQNLLKEGVPDSEIIVTGNTVIDALLMTASKDLELAVPLDPTKRLVLVTSHRRENFGEPFRNICQKRCAPLPRVTLQYSSFIRCIPTPTSRMWPTSSWLGCRISRCANRWTTHLSSLR